VHARGCTLAGRTVFRGPVQYCRYRRQYCLGSAPAGTSHSLWIADWNGDDIGAYLRTDRSRIADLPRGRLERFSLETLLRLLDRAGMHVELQVTRRSLGRR
jgi:hypothetical protein